MARKKTEVSFKEFLKIDERQSYKVIKSFKSVINDNTFICRPGDIVMLTPFEYTVLSDYLEG